MEIDPQAVAPETQAVAPGPEAQAPVAPGQEVPGPEVGPTGEVGPQEQEEYERAMTELGDVLYSNEKTSKALVEMINPEDKVGSTVKAVLSLVTSMDDKINMDEGIIYNITMEAADRLIDLAESAGKEFNEKETEQVALAAWEGMMTAYDDEAEGNLQEDHDYLAEGMSDVEKKQAETKYQELSNG